MYLNSTASIKLLLDFASKCKILTSTFIAVGRNYNIGCT